MGEDDTTPVSNNTYDKLKAAAQLILPAVGALYFAVGALLGWDSDTTTAVVGIIAAVNVFVGVVVTALKRSYGPTVKPEAVNPPDAVL